VLPDCQPKNDRDKGRNRQNDQRKVRKGLDEKNDQRLWRSFWNLNIFFFSFFVNYGNLIILIYYFFTSFLPKISCLVPLVTSEFERPTAMLTLRAAAMPSRLDFEF
jgi:hypothetical protein